MTITPLPANLSTLAPPAFDELVKEAWFAAATAEALVEARMGRLKRATGEKLEWVGNRQVYRSLPTETIARAEADLNAPAVGSITRNVGDILAEYWTAVEARDAIHAQELALQAEYDRRPWPRYVATTGSDAHIHKDMHCSTCNRGAQRTAFVFLTELSGTPLDEALAQFTTTLCTVCYPDAPVAPAPPRKTREQLSADREAAAERARVAEPKNISDVDGKPLRVDGNVLRTVRSAETAAVNALDWAAYGRHVGRRNERFAREHEEQARKIVAALAAKNGTTPADELARLTIKAIAKVKKVHGAEIAAAAAAEWAQQAQDAAPALTGYGRCSEGGDERDAPTADLLLTDSTDRESPATLAAIDAQRTAAGERLTGLVVARIIPREGDGVGGLIGAGAVLEIAGTRYPIPDRHPAGGFLAPLRISMAIRAAGYQPAEGYYESLDVDGPGTIRLVPFAGEPVDEDEDQDDARVVAAAAGDTVLDTVLDRTDDELGRALAAVPAPRAPGPWPCETQIGGLLDGLTPGEFAGSAVGVGKSTAPHWSDRMRAQVVETWQETLRQLLRGDGFVPAFTLGSSARTLQHAAGVAVRVDGDGVEITYPDDNVDDGEAGEGRRLIRLVWGTDYSAVRDVAAGLVMLVEAGNAGDQDSEQCVGRGPSDDDEAAE